MMTDSPPDTGLVTVPGTDQLEAPEVDQPKPIDIDAQIREALRELSLRERKFPRWVQEGTLPANVADYRIRAMQAIVRSLKRLKQPELL